ncbi:hypothetical protein J5N97_027698 [Dioscorea zingiberensis]|uniref:DUF4378 domain-containing protein n=1 Tax=Dioscorea zingiberensis TaxID=325984 RepID=A0A9D5BXU3_9LILI|nr:hypothetical protein J5N97_027698 [Dioscorea zingiberensis]
MSRISASGSLEHGLSAGNGGRSRHRPGFAGEEEMDIEELQLLQVSEGAHRLTEMIDSWSKAPNIYKRSKDVARDILRGALDLQESLAMLAKLQDASKHMSKMERKKVANEAEFEEIGSSRRFSTEGNNMYRLQEPRLSVDGSSRDCVEELRRVIGESFYRQKLLSRSVEDERASSSRSLRFNPEDEFKEPFLQTKKREEEKLSSTKPPMYPMLDAKMPKMRKPQVMQKNMDPGKRTLEEIIDRMQLKGLLRSGQVEHTSTGSMVAEVSLPNRYTKCFNENDELPPIVIMKPMKPPNRERGEAKKEELQSQKTDTKLAESIQDEKLLGKGRMLSDKEERKEVKRMEKTKIEFFQKVKEFDANKQQQKEAFKNTKKLNDRQKPLLNAKKLEVKNDIKNIKAAKSPTKASKTLSKPQEKVTTTEAKRHLSSQTTRPQKHSSSTAPKCILEENPISSLKERKMMTTTTTTTSKLVKTSTITTTKAAKDGKKRKEDGKETKNLQETDTISTESNHLPDNDQTTEAKMDQKPCSKDDKTEYEENYCEAKPNIISESAAEAIHLPKKNKLISDDLKYILLSSQSFFVQAQELICPKHQPIYRRKNIESVDTTHAKLFLDCANELMTRKSLQNEQSRHPMLQSCIWSPALYHSLDHLLQEISNEFEKLTSYNAVNHSATTEDNLYVRLEKDLRNKDTLIDSMWDVGWLNLICVEEADQVVSSVEEEIIHCLIEELAMELVL